VVRLSAWVLSGWMLGWLARDGDAGWWRGCLLGCWLDAKVTESDARVAGRWWSQMFRWLAGSKAVCLDGLLVVGLSAWISGGWLVVRLSA